MGNTDKVETRVEHDLLGDIEVPWEALHGAQTQRALENFPLGRARTIGGFPALIDGLMYIKEAAARVNGSLGEISDKHAGAIADAALKVRSDPLYEAFPLHYLHGGGGTSANMNANEVLANLAEAALGGQYGRYRLVHPNNHVNRNQSTNDVYPTACHMAVLLQWPRLEAAMRGLIATLEKRAREWSGRERLARTCLQDAVVITFADLLGGYVGVLRRGTKRVGEAVSQLYVVPLGGTIVGRAGDVSSAYLTGIVPELARVTGVSDYRQSENLFDAAQNIDDLAAVSAALSLLSGSLLKISQDLRLMSSGPEAGLGEISLPPVQPGSSIMPGKVNPVIPEFVIQVCLRVAGSDLNCQACHRHGELDLNVWESPVVFGLLESMELLENAVTVLDRRCIAGMTINTERNIRNTHTVIPSLTEMMRTHGYSAVSDICREAEGDLKKIKERIKNLESE